MRLISKSNQSSEKKIVTIVVCFGQREQKSIDFIRNVRWNAPILLVERLRNRDPFGQRISKNDAQGVELKL